MSDPDIYLNCCSSRFQQYFYIFDFAYFSKIEYFKLLMPSEKLRSARIRIYSHSFETSSIPMNKKLFPGMEKINKTETNKPIRFGGTYSYIYKYNFLRKA